MTEASGNPSNFVVMLYNAPPGPGALPGIRIRAPSGRNDDRGSDVGEADLGVGSVVDEEREGH